MRAATESRTTARNVSLLTAGCMSSNGEQFRPAKSSTTCVEIGPALILLTYSLLPTPQTYGVEISQSSTAQILRRSAG